MASEPAGVFDDDCADAIFDNPLQGSFESWASFDRIFLRDRLVIKFVYNSKPAAACAAFDRSTPALFAVFVRSDACRRTGAVIGESWAGLGLLAEGVGFEPTVDLRPRRFSRPVP